jgi:hypothetical protein
MESSSMEQMHVSGVIEPSFEKDSYGNPYR